MRRLVALKTTFDMVKAPTAQAAILQTAKDHIAFFWITHKHTIQLASIVVQNRGLIERVDAALVVATERTGDSGDIGNIMHLLERYAERTKNLAEEMLSVLCLAIVAHLKSIGYVILTEPTGDGDKFEVDLSKSAEGDHVSRTGVKGCAACCEQAKKDAESFVASLGLTQPIHVMAEQKGHAFGSYHIGVVHIFYPHGRFGA
jgi:hypothetical protein